jgi:hypothetical protein
VPGGARQRVLRDLVPAGTEVRVGGTQLAGWLPKGGGRLVRSTGRRPDEALDADLTALPRFLRRQGRGPGSGWHGTTTSPIRATWSGRKLFPATSPPPARR